MMYIKSINFSNPKLRIYYKWIPVYINKVRIEKEELNKTLEKLKDKISRPYHKALIKASVLNELKDKILYSLKNVDCCDRNNFMRLYNIKSFCEGCKTEPIQEEAHIIMKCKGERIKKLKDYLQHYANLWLLCGTCHRIVDGRGGNVSKRRENLTINNLKSRLKIQKRIYEDLKEDRNFLVRERRKLEKLRGWSNEKVVREMNIILGRWKIKE